MQNQTLTDREYWDNRWERIKLPVEIREETAKHTTRQIIKIVSQTLPRKDHLKILEIGGSPGKWLAYFKKNYRYDIYAIDYSEIGCTKMKENFDVLNLEATIYRCNILTDDLSNLPRFDIVYSMGFIEHFRDLNTILKKHLELIGEGGILMIGVPNFAGVTRFVLKKTAPRIFSTHNLQAMDIKNWRILEEKYRLIPLFKGYIGGFDLHHCRRCENRTLVNKTIRLFFKLTTRFTDNFTFFRKFNSGYWSPYLFGIYKKR